MTPTSPHTSKPDPVPAPILLIAARSKLRDELTAALQTQGYATLLAPSGNEGLEQATGQEVAGVIVEDMLPDIEGASLVPRLRKRIHDTPCILLTSSLQRASQPEVLESGSDAYLLHDLGAPVIVGRLQTLLGHASSAEQRVSSPERTTARLLAVDDSPAALQLLSLAFEPDGYELLFAHSGAEALERLERETVDCVLLDLMMPGLSGQQVCERIKTSPALRDLPVLMLTVREDEDTMLAAIHAGADDYIVKSSSFQIVRARVRSQIRRRAHEEENRRMREALHDKELESMRERAAREFAQSGAVALAELDRVKDEFLSIVSHDLRTPLAVISGSVSNVLSGVAGEVTENQRAFLEMAQRNALRLNAMIADLLDLSRIQAGALVLREDRLELRSAVQEVLAETQTLADERGLSVQMQAGDTPIHLTGDAGRVGQVVLNLVSNASRFAHGLIRVQLHSEGESAVIEVEDDGPGIPADAFDRLFNRFTRVEEHGRKSKTGLGLSIVRAITEAHGGTVHAENRLDPDGSVAGARFVVSLPLKLEREAADGPQAPGRPRSRVLVVEDESDLRDIIATRLKAMGCDVAEAADGETALEHAEHGPVDLALIDVGLPGIDGFEVAEHLTAGRHPPDVLFMTAREDAASRTRGRRLGAVAYLTKPFDPTELTRHVRTALRMQQAGGPANAAKPL